MSKTRPWPDVPEEGRWTIEMMEELLANTDQSPEELLARAKDLRAEAADADIDEYRNVALVLAERYEAAAADRLATS